MSERTSEAKQNSKKLAAGLVIGACLVVLLACAAVWMYMDRNAIRTQKGFSAYASEVLDETQVYEPAGGHITTEYQIDGQIGTAIRGDETGYEYVNACRDVYVAALKNGIAPAEKDDFYGIIINTAVCESDRDTVSFLMSYVISSLQDGEMVEESRGVRTWTFDKVNGQQLQWKQVFRDGYTKKVEKYFDGERRNFSHYMLGEEELTYFFLERNEETGLDEIRTVKLEPEVYEGWVRTFVSARGIDPDKPMVALTYDDGPGLASEDKIHDILEKHGAVATFFYSGYMIKGREDRIKRSLENGCEIGNHTWDHPVLTRCSKKNLKNKQFAKTNKLIKEACGQGPTVFRPSYGITNEKINEMSGLPVILWDVDTLDWKTRNAKKIFRSVKKTKKLDGKIILMHCIYDETAEATAKIVPWLEENGYQMVTVSELIRYKKGETPKAGKVYR